jgi:hypothetical protein
MVSLIAVPDIAGQPLSPLAFEGFPISGSAVLFATFVVTESRGYRWRQAAILQGTRGNRIEDLEYYW